MQQHDATRLHATRDAIFFRSKQAKSGHLEDGYQARMCRYAIGETDIEEMPLVERLGEKLRPASWFRKIANPS